MAHISNEVLTSQVDGVNKVFTLAFPVTQVINLKFDGAEYFDFTITDIQEITLVDAPTVTSHIDYLTAPVAGTGGGVTAQYMLDLLRRQQDDVLPDLEDDQFLDFINWINQEAYMALFRINPEDYLVDTTINVVADDDSYDTAAILTVGGLGAGLFEEDEEFSLPETGFRSERKGFYTQGNTLRITPVPSQDETLTFRYIPILPNLEALGDQLVISEQNILYLKDTITASFYEWSKNGLEVGSSQRLQFSFRQFLVRSRKGTGAHII